MNIKEATARLVTAHMEAGKSFEEAYKAAVMAMLTERPHLAGQLLAALRAEVA